MPVDDRMWTLSDRDLGHIIGYEAGPDEH